MNVFAFSTSRAADWRWRFVDFRGETVEESSVCFPTIAAAVAAGTEQLQRSLNRYPPPLTRTPVRRSR
jgi:hypothetical protein